MLNCYKDWIDRQTWYTRNDRIYMDFGIMYVCCQKFFSSKALLLNKKRKKTKCLQNSYLALNTWDGTGNLYCIIHATRCYVTSTRQYDSVHDSYLFAHKLTIYIWNWNCHRRLRDSKLKSRKCLWDRGIGRLPRWLQSLLSQ